MLTAYAVCIAGINTRPSLNRMSRKSIKTASIMQEVFKHVIQRRLSLNLTDVIPSLTMLLILPSIFHLTGQFFCSYSGSGEVPNVKFGSRTFYRPDAVPVAPTNSIKAPKGCHKNFNYTHSNNSYMQQEYDQQTVKVILQVDRINLIICTQHTLITVCCYV